MCLAAACPTRRSLDGSVGGIVGSHHGGEICGCKNIGAVTGGESAGIVGMVGGGLYLSTGGDSKDASQVNSPDAGIVFTGCHSDMTFSAPDESEYVYDDDGTPVFLNRFGGILGFSPDSAGLAFRVENCTFTGCERGLGNADLPDVGTKNPG